MKVGDNLGILDELFQGVSDTQGTLTEEQKQSDVERCRYSLVEFVKTYLNDGSGEPLDELCEFHYEISSRLEDIVLNRKTESTESCILSPRGHGKSFWTSFAFPLWCIAYKHTRNILIVTNESSLGRQFIVDIRQFLEDNEKFIADFGSLIGATIWTSEKLQCSNGICVSSKGAGASMRGVKMFGVRPTVIVCDDILNNENSDNDDQRKKLYDWYTKVLYKCGSKFCHVFVIGTLLNDACLLARMMNDEQFSDYYTKKYQAIKEYSTSHLWDQWTDIRNNLSNHRRIKDADDFYFDNKEEMLEGTEVLWDRYADTYLHLMKERQKIGEEAWGTEMQNDPVTDATREFKEDWIDRNTYEIDELPELTDIYIGVDAAATANRKSDDGAIVVVGKGVDNYFYVLDVFAKKATIDTLSEQMIIYGIQYHRDGKIRRIAIEDVVFQLLAVKDNMERRCLNAGLYLPFEGIKVKQFGSKQTKIRSLIIPMRSGWIKVRKDQRRLLDEMRRFPKGKSDNTLDALWIAVTGFMGTSLQSFSFASLPSPKKQQSNSNIFQRLLRR